jgi:glycosyltransferase involved in cell wall biosynthesis
VGLRVTIVSTHGPDFRDDIVHQLRSAGVGVILIGPTSRLLARHRQIKPVLRGLISQSDVVHIHGLWEEIQHQAATVARQRGVPYLITPHGMLDPWSLSQSAIKKRLYLALRLRHDLNNAAAIHFTDEVERDLTAPLKLTAPALVERLIIDLHDFASLPPRGQFRAKYRELLTDDRPIVLFLGRLHHKKGLELLIPAMADVKPGNAVLVIAGPDSGDGYRARLEALARQQGIADRTLFTGMLYGGDRVAALVDADVFALPSYQENFGVAVIESLAAGTPVVISDQVNIHRQISENRLGGVVRTDASSVAAELTRWLTDATLRQDASRRAPEFVRAQYDREQIARRWAEHYARLAMR